MITLIGICGKKQSGKDTVAMIMDELWHPNFVHLGFADELKKEVSKAFGVTLEYINAHKTQFRGLLQHWGMLRRELKDKDYWVVKLFQKLVQLDTPFQAITDVRFVNEANYIKQAGGILVRVVRNIPNDGDTHPSETELDNYTVNANIANIGTIDDLRIEVKKTLKQLKILK